MTLPLESQIRAAFAAEQAQRKKARALGEIPVDYDALTDEWLTAVLCRDAPGARVTGHRLGEPDEGTNNRRRVFVDYNDPGRAARLPPTVFCKATSGLRNRLMLAHSGAIRCEVGFYRHVRDHVDFEAPRAFHADFDPHSFNSIIVIEDLAGKGRFLDLGGDGSVALMREQLDLLARLHGRWAGDPDLDRRFAALPSWEERFRGLMVVNLEAACGAGLDRARDHLSDRLWQQREAIWPATIASLDAQAELPRGLAHGDVHLHNWYRLDDGTLGLGDWGVTHRGHWGRDLGYCLASGLSIADRRRHESDLVGFYLDRLAAHGGGRIAIDEAWAHIRPAIMTALAFWTMTIAPAAEMPDMQPAETALVFTARIAAAVDDWNALASGKR